MAIPVTVGDIIQARIFCKMQDQGAINVLHYRVLAVNGGTPTLEQLANFYGTSVSAPLATLLTDTADYRGVGMQIINPTLSAEVYDVASATAGTAGSTPLPKQACGLISKRTATAGPHSRGRMYVPFPDEDDNEADATCSAAYKAGLATLGAFLFDDINVTVLTHDADYRPVIWDRSALVFRDITAIIARDRWATQRRRGDFGQPNSLPI